MRIGNGTFAFRGPQPLQTSAPPRVQGPSRDTMRLQLRRVNDEIDDLRDVLRTIRAQGGRGRAVRILGTAHGFQTGTTPGTSAVLQSKAEVNTEATQLSSRKPQWAGPGGRAVTIGGVYNGATDDTLTFTVTGPQSRTIEVRNGVGDLVDSFNLSNQPANPTTKATVGGLSVTFGGGVALTAGDSFTLGVTASTDGAIDPDDAFNGLGDASPRFEEGTVIKNGSFFVNGTEVSVSTGDSLNDVLSRITSLVAGVTATYDADTEQVTLETTATGASQTLEITGDTSGLIAALKLDGLGQVAGTDGVAETSMATTAGFEGVTAGTLTINGTAVNLDPSTQTLSDLLGAISSIDGVVARLDAHGQVEIYGKAGQPLTLDDGGTGLFAAIGVTAGTHRSAQGSGTKLNDFAAHRLTVEMTQLRKALDDLVDNEGLLGVTADMRTRIGVAVETSLRDAEGVEDIASLLGLDDFKDDQVASRSRTSREMRRAYGDVKTLMLGEDRRKGGLLDQLDDIVRDGLRDVDSVDAWA